MCFQITKRENFKNDFLLLDEIKNVIHTSYKEFDTLNGYLKKDLTDCNEIYLTIDRHEKVVGFFMVGLQNINEKQYYYLGLSSCRDDLKNRGIGKAMYLSFASDLKIVEGKLGKRINCYWTTVSPIPYY